MTDERIDAMLRQLDIPSRPDEAFIEDTYRFLAPRARKARRADQRPTWLRDALRALHVPIDRPTFGVFGRAPMLAAILLLILALLATIALAGALRRLESGGNGLLLVAQAGTLQAVDPETSMVREVATGASGIIGVTRSPDGRLASYWTGPGQGDRLFITDVAGSDPRPVALDDSLLRLGCVDAWSADSGWLAAAVRVRAVTSILVVDTRSRLARTIVPPSGSPDCPLWSPDGRLITFVDTTPDGRRTLAVIGVDGGPMRQVSGDLGDLDVQGPDSWSPDGAWIYFSAANGSRGHVYRADVATGQSQQLTSDAIAGFAPALSPDGTLVSYIAVGVGPGYDEHVMKENVKYDLYVMRPDGSGSHLVLAHATNDGWSADGAHILTEWHPTTSPLDGGLAVIAPDGGAPVVVLPYVRVCGTASTNSCFDGVGWGQPTP